MSVSAVSGENSLDFTSEIQENNEEKQVEETLSPSSHKDRTERMRSEDVLAKGQLREIATVKSLLSQIEKKEGKPSEWKEILMTLLNSSTEGNYSAEQKTFHQAIDLLVTDTATKEELIDALLLLDPAKALEIEGSLSLSAKEHVNKLIAMGNRLIDHEKKEEAVTVLAKAKEHVPNHVGMFKIKTPFSKKDQIEMMREIAKVEGRISFKLSYHTLQDSLDLLFLKVEEQTFKEKIKTALKLLAIALPVFIFIVCARVVTKMK